MAMRVRGIRVSYRALVRNYACSRACAMHKAIAPRGVLEVRSLRGLEGLIAREVRVPPRWEDEHAVDDNGLVGYRWTGSDVAFLMDVALRRSDAVQQMRYDLRYELGHGHGMDRYERALVEARVLWRMREHLRAPYQILG